MVYTAKQLAEKYSEYSDLKGKIFREVKENKLIRIKRGLYETDFHIDGRKLAQYIYGPSYLSFHYVLSQYSIIPEAVYTYTCATCNKNRKKKYDTPFGYYSYRDVPKQVFQYGVETYKDNGYTFQMATKEKALCDLLYTLTPVESMKEFNFLFFEDLRIEEEDLLDMDKEFILKVAPLYKSTNLDYLVKMLSKN